MRVRAWLQLVSQLLQVDAFIGGARRRHFLLVAASTAPSSAAIPITSIAAETELLEMIQRGGGVVTGGTS